MRSLVLSIVAGVAGFGVGYWVFDAGEGKGKPAAPEIGLAAGHSAPAKGTTPAAADLQPSANEAKPKFTGSLQEALRGLNPLESAQRAEAWLERATALDFAALAEDPKKCQPHSNAFQGGFRGAFYTALLTRWLEVDPNAFEAAMRMHDTMKASDPHEASDFLGILGRMWPERVLEKRWTEFEKRKYLNLGETEAFRTLAANDVERARQVAAGLPPDLRGQAEVAIVTAIAERDPLSALALARGMDRAQALSVAGAIVSAAERIGPGMLRQVFATDEGLLDQAGDLTRLLLKYPDLAAEVQPQSPSKTATAATVHVDAKLLHHADMATPEERAATLARYDQMPPGIRDSVAGALVAAWARTEPKQAAEWALAHAKPDEARASQNQAAHLAFLRWIHVDRDAALTWFRQLSPSPLRDAIGTNASTYIAEAGDLKMALEMNRPTADEGDRNATAHLVQIVAERDPASAAALVAGASDEAVSSEAISALLFEWYSKDKVAVAGWLETLPPGARRDQALKEFVTKVSRDNAEAAAAWTETVEDQRLRQQAAGWTYFALRRENPARAKDWILNLPGIDETWRGRLLRRP